MRLSATALRDYQFCGQYYRYRRVHRVPQTGATPLYLAVGSLLHASYYYAHAVPVQQGRRVGWSLTGTFQPDRARRMFESLWHDEPRGLSGDELAHWTLLMADKTPWHSIRVTTGQTKALKDPDPARRRAAWFRVYASMLDTALEVTLPGPVCDIERRVEYSLGDVPMLGYIDLVCRAEDGTEIYLDIKTGVNAPDAEKVKFNPQQQLYYLDGPSAIYLWHFKTGLIYVERNLPLIEGLIQTAPLIVDLVEAGVFRKRLDEECAGCVFREQCYGQT